MTQASTIAIIATGHVAKILAIGMFMLALHEGCCALSMWKQARRENG